MAAWRPPGSPFPASVNAHPGTGEGDLPSFGGATGWLNPEPLTAAGLRGRVVEGTDRPSEPSKLP